MNQSGDGRHLPNLPEVGTSDLFLFMFISFCLVVICVLIVHVLFLIPLTDLIEVPTLHLPENVKSCDKHADKCFFFFLKDLLPLKQIIKKNVGCFVLLKSTF